ncbi:hypothetical protein Val02_78970 [Virgisporangium aliadipatigenens]|uniref:Uncharacterized protein n=1 Tax=Virgisporangium aliadipatigenens TaxID=741659 RepID=A0A8J4DV26_9ACTN|nr:hypothetical protein Val02_78970 [Virgisporangium aliadipatigenens]
MAIGMLGRNIATIVSPVIEGLSNATFQMRSPTAPPNANSAIAAQPSPTSTSSVHARRAGRRETASAADPIATAHAAPISSATGTGTNGDRDSPWMTTTKTAARP